MQIEMAEMLNAFYHLFAPKKPSENSETGSVDHRKMDKKLVSNYRPTSLLNADSCVRSDCLRTLIRKFSETSLSEPTGREMIGFAEKTVDFFCRRAQERS